MNKGTYNTGQVIDIKTIKEDEFEQAINEWSEGDENLKSALITCKNNGLETIACCAGHPDNGYIAIKITPENETTILNIMNETSSLTGSDTILMPSIECRNYPMLIYSIKDANVKEKGFKKFIDACNDKTTLDKCNPVIRELYTFFRSLEIEKCENIEEIIYSNNGLLKKQVHWINTNEIPSQIPTTGTINKWLESGVVKSYIPANNNRGIARFLRRINESRNKLPKIKRKNTRNAFIDWLRNMGEESVSNDKFEGEIDKSHNRDSDEKDR